MTCPAAITIAGTEYPCQNETVPHLGSPNRHWAKTDKNYYDPNYWSQDVTPPEPLALVEWLEQEVPFNKMSGQYYYGVGRQAVLDAAARWEPPAPAPVDLGALADVIRDAWIAAEKDVHEFAARAVLFHLGLMAK